MFLPHTKSARYFLSLSRTVSTIFLADQSNNFQVDLETTPTLQAVPRCSAPAHFIPPHCISWGLPRAPAGDGACKPPAAGRAEMLLLPSAFL